MKEFLARTPPGDRGSYRLDVNGTSTTLVILVVRGRKDGPTLLVTSGIHGDEPDGTFAIHDFCRVLDPKGLSGNVVALPACNEGAFLAGARCNLLDVKDLARGFPGDMRGSATDRLAAVLASRFIAEVDFLCDLHSAGQPYEIQPLAGYYLVGGERQERQRKAAIAFGAPFVWGTSVQPGRSLGLAAEVGTPAIFTETGGQGRARPNDIAAYSEGLTRLAACLGMIDGAFPREPGWFLEEAGAEAGHMQTQHRVSHWEFFQPNVGLWQRVEQGEAIGRLFTRGGEVIEEICAERDGRVLMLRTQAVIAPGDSAGVIVPVKG